MKLAGKITFRPSPVKEIEIRSRAESMSISLSKFILYCIDKEVNRSKTERRQEEAQKKKEERLHDFDRLIASMVEINRTAHQSVESVKQLREDIYSAMSAAFPEKRIMFSKIFSDLI